MATRKTEGWHGWDAYAPFYDWENARTLGRRDVAFWVRTLAQTRGPVLELGCGTGRLLAPIARSWLDADGESRRTLVGIDRSVPMLARARRRVARLARAVRPFLLRADVRALPIRTGKLGSVVAAYGLLQSLLTDRDLDATLASAARVLRRGGLLGIDLVPDLPVWEEYAGRIPIRGQFAPGTTLTLVESVRQDRRKGLTIFDEQYVVRRGRTVRKHRFQLTFRTLSLEQTLARVERAGFRVDQVCGSYEGDPWHPGADVWVVLARRR
ncbi:MAG: class I SAM-dependent methyltransferase [Vicinamibacterales bacterium]